jgi:hypothetical protein
MTPSDYWDGDIWMVEAYRKKHSLDIESRNQELWMQGLYVYNAFGVVLSNAFAKKGRYPQKYIEKPIRITPLSPEEKAELAEQERQKTIAFFTQMKQDWNKKEAQ